MQPAEGGPIANVTSFPAELSVTDLNLSTLPTEIILCIYSFQSSLANACSFSGTCPRLRQIWKVHSHSLLERILWHQIGSFEEAESLLEMQEMRLMRDRELDEDTSFMRSQSWRRALVALDPSATFRARQLMQNARITTEICRLVIRQAHHPRWHGAGCLFCPHVGCGTPSRSKEYRTALKAVYFVQRVAIAQPIPETLAQQKIEYNALSLEERRATYDIMKSMTIGQLAKAGHHGWNIAVKCGVTDAELLVRAFYPRCYKASFDWDAALGYLSPLPLDRNLEHTMTIFRGCPRLHLECQFAWV